MILTKIEAEISRLASPAKAKILAGFFKTGVGQYGAGDKFLGIVVPLQRQLVKKYYREINYPDITTLLHSPWHEKRLIALLMLVAKFKKADEHEQEKIYQIYLKNTKYINNWDLVDLSAPKIVGAYLEEKDKAILYKLAKSKNVWERRIAILSTFHFIYKGQPEETLKIAFLLKDDKHDLIHKAVGWMLREVGKRCGQDIEENFLKKYYKEMPRTMLRYAIEKFPEKKRKFYLIK